MRAIPSDETSDGSGAVDAVTEEPKTEAAISFIKG